MEAAKSAVARIEHRLPPNKALGHAKAQQKRIEHVRKFLEALPTASERPKLPTAWHKTEVYVGALGTNFSELDQAVDRLVVWMFTLQTAITEDDCRRRFENILRAR